MAGGFRARMSLADSHDSGHPRPDDPGAACHRASRRNDADMTTIRR